MTTRIRVILAVLGCVWLSTPVLLAAEQPANPPGAAASILYALLPMAFIGGILWLFLRKSQRSPFIQRSEQHYVRSEEHMERMEQLLERIAAALERGQHRP